jgi:hypothetical protein
MTLSEPEFDGALDVLPHATANASIRAIPVIPANLMVRSPRQMKRQDLDRTHDIGTTCDVSAGCVYMADAANGRVSSKNA